MSANRRNLRDHRFLVSGFDSGLDVRHDDRTYDSERRRQTNLEPNAFRDVAAPTSSEEIKIGGAGFAGVAELTETHLLGSYAFREGKEREFVRRAYRSRGVRTQERTCSE